MPRAKAVTGGAKYISFCDVSPAENARLNAKLLEIIGPSATRAALQGVADAMQRYQQFSEQAVSAPTLAESAKALEAIVEHSAALRRLLGSGADEAHGALKAVRSTALGRHALDRIRPILDDLIDATRAQFGAFPDAPQKGRRVDVRRQHQVNLALALWQIVESLGVQPSLTHDPDGRPASRYTRLVEWALHETGGGDFRSITKAARDAMKGKVQARTE
jgi:hypothetical protein